MWIEKSYCLDYRQELYNRVVTLSDFYTNLGVLFGCMLFGSGEGISVRLMIEDYWFLVLYCVKSMIFYSPEKFSVSWDI